MVCVQKVLLTIAVYVFCHCFGILVLACKHAHVNVRCFSTCASSRVRNRVLLLAHRRIKRARSAREDSLDPASRKFTKTRYDACEHSTHDENIMCLKSSTFLMATPSYLCCESAQVRVTQNHSSTDYLRPQVELDLYAQRNTMKRKISDCFAQK